MISSTVYNSNFHTPGALYIFRLNKISFVLSMLVSFSQGRRGGTAWGAGRRDRLVFAPSGHGVGGWEGGGTRPIADDTIGARDTVGTRGREGVEQGGPPKKWD